MSKIKLAVVPVKRGFLPLDAAQARASEIFKQIGHIAPNKVEIVKIDDVVPSGVLWDDYPALERVINKLTGEKLDGLFMPHVDFGTEEVVGKVARAVNAPFLLWGIRDIAERLRPQDTQCGVFASSRALQRNGVPFSYIVNSAVDSATFLDGYRQFLGATSVVKQFRHMKVLQVSMRPRQFMSVIYNDDQLMRNFGMEVIPVSASQIFARMKKVSSGDIAEGVQNIRARMATHEVTDDQLNHLAALKIALLALMHENGASCCALECWSLFGAEMGFVPCQVIGDLCGMGVPVACETDVLGAISSALLQAASLDNEPTFFADLTIRHPENDNAELLWHCGPFPYELKHANSPAALEGGRGQWYLRDGDITLTRFDALDGNYRIFAGEGHTCAGPETIGTYVWFETRDWAAWEKAIINGPYIHHVSGAYGKYADILAEATKFMPGVQTDRIL